MSVSITQNELIAYAVLNRRAKELRFKKNFFLRNGATPEDVHVKALIETLNETEEELTIIKNKITAAGIMPIMLHRKEIEELSEKIKSYTPEDVMEAVRKKHGDLYDILRKRSELSRKNFEFKEEIAELTLLLNSIPLDLGEEIRAFVESSGESSGGCTRQESNGIELEGVPEEKISRIVTLMARMGINVRQDGDKIVPSEESILSEEPRTVNGRKVWIRSEYVKRFDEVEKELDKVVKGIQAITTKKQVEPLTHDEKKRFEELQKRYVKLVSEREHIINGDIPDGEELGKEN